MDTSNPSVGLKILPMHDGTLLVFAELQIFGARTHIVPGQNTSIVSQRGHFPSHAICKYAHENRFVL